MYTDFSVSIHYSPFWLRGQFIWLSAVSAERKEKGKGDWHNKTRRHNKAELEREHSKTTPDSAGQTGTTVSEKKKFYFKQFWTSEASFLITNIECISDTSTVRVQVWNLMDVLEKFNRSKRLEARPLF